jgi:uncharacterized protein involved in exopolysaccharide biosynthesis
MYIESRERETIMADTLENQDEIGLYELTSLFWSKRWFILLVTVSVTLLAGGAAFIVQKKYQATVTISPVSSSASNSQLGALNSVTSQFSGLASLAGLSVGGDSKKSESLAVLQSEALTESYIQKNDLLPILYRKQWDPVGKKWKVSDPNKVPTLWKANQFFKKNVRTVVNDTKTGLTTLTITWNDPQLAAKWANDLVRMANDYLRDQAIRESERNIAYLNEQASKTDVVGIRQAIYTLLQNEINKAMLARGSDEYALKVVDPAFSPESPSSPIKLLWVIGGFLGGCFSAMLTVLMRNAWHGASLKRR